MAVVALCWPAMAQAQMFSVETRRDPVSMPDVAVHAGVDWLEMASLDASAIDPAYPDYSFSAPLLRMAVETRDIDVHAVFGRDLRDVNLSYTELGAELKSDYTVFRRRSVSVGIPLSVSTVYTLVRSRESATTASEFNQNTIGFGTGVSLNLRLGSSFRLRTAAKGGWGFVANGLNSEGGTVSQAEWTTRLHADGLARHVGLAVGLDAHTRRYALDNASLEYRIRGWALTAAVTF